MTLVPNNNKAPAFIFEGPKAFPQMYISDPHQLTI